MSDQPTQETSLPRTMSASEAEARRQLLAALAECARFRLVFAKLAHDCPCDNDGQGCPCADVAKDALTPPEKGKEEQ